MISKETAVGSTREIVLLASIAFACAACGDDPAADDPARETQLETLDACGLPEPCDTGQITYGLEPPTAAECILSTLEAGGGAHLSIVSGSDGGGDCSATIHLFVDGAGSVLVWRKSDNDCSVEVVDFDYALERCTMQPPDFFTSCLETVNGPNPSYECEFWSRWYTGCQAAEPACP